MPKVEAGKIDEVVKHFKIAQRVVAFTGAGISAESGIPTFRGSGGLWENYRIEEVATPEAFRKDPRLVWDFYLERRRGTLSVKPNPAHNVIASWEKKFSFTGVVTQNIDGLHAKAGSTNIQELHGNLWKVHCVSCENIQKDEALEWPELPHCEKCGGLLRPHIVWFGEPLDFEIVQKSLEWMKEADMIFIVGTSGVVEPAASFVREAKRYNPFLVEVNLEETALTPICDASLFGKSGEIFEKWFGAEGVS